MNNSCDPALKRYRFIACYKAEALGYWGLARPQLLGEYLSRYEEMEAAYQVGRQHDSESYLQNRALMCTAWSRMAVRPEGVEGEAEEQVPSVPLQAASSGIGESAGAAGETPGLPGNVEPHAGSPSREQLLVQAAWMALADWLSVEPDDGQNADRGARQ